jgi:hypothetical protein
LSPATSHGFCQAKDIVMVCRSWANTPDHHMAKRSRTLLVEARVVETKQKFSRSLENITFNLFTFLYSVSIFHSFAPALLLLLFFT